MTSVPFLFIPLVALFCYIFILAALLAAKKNPLINSYIMFIIGFMMWTGGSLFMRLQVGPSMFFWYDISILSLFSIALFIYLFVYHYARAKGHLLTIIWAIGTIIILVLTHFEVFLKRPEAQLLPDGRTIFVYDTGWEILIPSAFFVLIVISIVRMLVKMMKEKSGDTLGVKMIILGCIFLVVGNLASILPGNIFPFDTLSGILNALCLLYALYKKRMFKMTLLVSKNILLLTSVIIVGIPCSYITKPLNDFFIITFPNYADYSIIFVTSVMGFLIWLVYRILKEVIDKLFGKEEQQQAKSIEHFSFIAAQTLNTQDIMRELSTVIKENISVEKIYICLKSKGKYEAKYSAQPLDSISFSISEDNPCIEYLKNEESSIILSDFKSNVLYKSMWEEEKRLLNDLGIACILALKKEDDIVGVVLLSAKAKKAAFKYDDMSFLSAVSSISSIALKNAELYERVYRESRIDSLTGLYNYKSFCEQIEEKFEEYKDNVISLLFLDIDDFKLYNQLYGANEGDRMLRAVTKVINYKIETKGVAFRYGGKVFACLFPGKDGRETSLIANEIRKCVSELNDAPERKLYKKLTISGGICVYPYAATDMSELISNADIALYNAKNNGKDRITFYTNESEEYDKENGSFLSNRFDENENSISMYSAYETTILALTAAIDAKDHYTFNHSQNVARYSTALATALGMNKERVRIIYEAALLHDIGKISIPDHILSKKGPLTDEEYKVIKTHVNNSIEIIRHLPSMDYVIPAAIGHHERWDGNGYPRGIAGENIPKEARCLAIADAFDAMTSNRSYREALPVEYAAEQILKNAGTQFDPEYAKAFVDLIHQEKIVVSNNDIVQEKSKVTL